MSGVEWRGNGNKATHFILGIGCLVQTKKSGSEKEKQWHCRGFKEGIIASLRSELASPSQSPLFASQIPPLGADTKDSR